MEPTAHLSQIKKLTPSIFLLNIFFTSVVTGITQAVSWETLKRLGV